MELWDAYDKNGNKIDGTLVRGKKVPEGVYHLVVETLVRHSDGDFLLMQRDTNKDVYPRRYESSAGGSALQHETADEAIRRELKEETGITSIVNLEHINTDTYLDSIFMTYVIVTDQDKDSVILQEGETIDYKWVTLEEYKEYIKSDITVPPQIDRLHSYLKTL